MPLYVHACACGHEREDYLSLSAPAPEHCGSPMKRVPQASMIAMTTRGGNLMYPTRAGTGSKWVGGGKPKPKTISRGHGLGGRRKPPSIQRALATGGKVQGKPYNNGKPF